MDVAVVLENRDEDFGQVEKLVYSYDSSMVIQRFTTVDGFAKWFGELASKPPEDNFVFAVLISNYQLLGAKHISLFQKINSFVKEKRYLAEGADRLPLLMTARDIEGFDRTHFQQAMFDNIVFKPMDLAVGKGKLDWAINRESALQNEETQKQKPVSPLEMLKDIQIDQISELGFRTVSTKPIELGKIARYYIPVLKPLGEDYGVYASCTFCQAVEGQKNNYVCAFSFFGLDDEKAKNIRKLIESSDANTPMELATIESETPGVVTIVEENDLANRLEGSLDASFKGMEFKKFENFMDFYAEIDAEKATKAWLEQFSNVAGAIVEFDIGSGIFTRIFKKGDEKALLDDYLGLSKEQFKRFKTLCLTSCRPEVRKNLGLFWSQENDATLALIIRDQKQTHFLSLVGSEIIENEKTKSKKLQIEIRPSTPEEVAECKKHERRLPKDLRLVITTERIAKMRSKEFWSELRAKVNPKRPPHEVPFIVIGKTKLRLFDQAKEMDCFSDYLVEPFDQVYLKKKAKFLLPELKVAEGKAERSTLKTNDIIKSGIQVDIKNFSEVSLSVEYHRPIHRDTYREFVIYIQQERRFEELLAKAVSHEKHENKKDMVINHFTLFGHGDKTNQYIRQWLGEQYVLSKKDEE